MWEMWQARVTDPIGWKGRKSDAQYAKPFDLLHERDGLDWLTIRKVILGFALYRGDYVIRSPLQIRRKTIKGDKRRWEAALRKLAWERKRAFARED